jgi:hypothetical protein
MGTLFLGSWDELVNGDCLLNGVKGWHFGMIMGFEIGQCCYYCNYNNHAKYRESITLRDHRRVAGVRDHQVTRHFHLGNKA